MISYMNLDDTAYTWKTQYVLEKYNIHPEITTYTWEIQQTL